jgi:hypothetical protein
VGVIGGGTMGAGIAVSVLDAGLPVTMIERDDETLSRGLQNVEKVYNGPVGALLGSAAKGLLVILRAGAPVAGAPPAVRSAPKRWPARRRCRRPSPWAVR